MTKSIFVDTSALIALGNKRDEFHQTAITRFDGLIDEGKQFITTYGVILEMANTFSRSEYKGIALQMIDMIKQSAHWDIIALDPDLIENGLNEFKRMSDKDWSLVDCISMIVAKQFEIQDVLTNDHHFEQAGFRILMKRS